ncbi:hypothetical protein LNAOJCKE_0958 [Methylorubrum aminovorans]|uniref:Uncharacterized protein n=1 Tax=Methylorubrum aminovorans TaxID=269069 RepID=A0ABQ4U8N5_9HYPH|nr:hypothetical protein [Methylorubrum aminovorans]GJE63760.1 hypothetical protein LNAOJCKE_0958 [Methylorubrum aminovorans]GMA73599.1 hypothetical protein GCM10025880_00160 [Methylorubrum aminovorans]GMA73687.1 hypothetical protein GCM10025880_01040 [Methylorubrum aminovorans]
MAHHFHRPVSNRGQWRGTLTVYTDSPPDPSETVFTFNAWPTDRQGGSRDYGWSQRGSGGFVLSASTDDETGRLSTAVNGNALIVSWLFPPTQMWGLPVGSFEGSISAIIADEMSEIEAFRFVVQARGSADRLRPLAPLPALPLPPHPLPPPPIVVLTPEAVAAILPTLPTTLPALPGLPWNNGGFLSWS